jgi:membrane protein DedA with SNARE-associated domain
MVAFLEHWGYLAVFLINFISAMAIPAGSEWATLGAGLLASGELTMHSHHQINIVAVIVVAFVADILGASVGYTIGRFGGRPLVDRFGKYVLLSHKDLDKTEAWFAKRGDPFAFFGRFIPLLRSFVGIVSGIGEMQFKKFVLFTGTASILGSAALCGLGYSLGSSWHHVLKDFGDVGYALGGLFVIVVIVALVHRIKTLRSAPSGS